MSRARKFRTVSVPAPRVAFRAYAIVSEAVERGVAYGIGRAHKHSDAPTASVIEHAVYEAVMSHLCEIFNFDEGTDDV